MIATLPLSTLRIVRSLAKDQRAAAAMEFAMIAPIFITMIMGILDFGQWAYARAELTGAVQQAADPACGHGGRRHRHGDPPAAGGVNRGTSAEIALPGARGFS